MVKHYLVRKLRLVNPASFYTVTHEAPSKQKCLKFLTLINIWGAAMHIALPKEKFSVTADFKSSVITARAKSPSAMLPASTGLGKPVPQHLR